MQHLHDAQHVLAVFQERVRIRPDDDAVTHVHDPAAGDAVSWTYAELDRQARRIGAWLQQRFDPLDRVLLLYPTGLGFVAGFFGCLYAGMIAVPAPLPGRYPHERRRVGAILRNAGARAVLTDSANLAAVRDWAATGPAGLTLSATDEPQPGPDPATWTQPHLDRDSVLLLQYTSGSTGDPKGVIVSHGNLLSNMVALARAYGVGPDTRYGGWIPLYHDMGLLGQLLPGLLGGRSCVLMNALTFLKRPVSWLTLIDRFDVDFSAAPNFAFDICARRATEADVAGLDLSRWTYASNGSEPIHAASLTAFTERFAPAGFRAEAVSPAYGLAESTVFVSSSNRRRPVLRRIDAQRLERGVVAPADAGEPERTLVSCGPVLDHEVRVVDLAIGEPLPEGRVGEIWLRGPSVSRGYWDNEQATAETFHGSLSPQDGGYLRTGDLGVLLAGELYVTGRVKETIIVHGRNLYPQDIEYELRAQHADLAAVGAVFTVPVGTGAGTVEDVVVVAHEVQGRPAPERLRELTAAIRQTVAREFGTRVGSVVLLPRGAVRRTTSGKIERSAMRALFRADELRSLLIDDDPRFAGMLRHRAPAAAVIG
jgi:acyl-CoA synthetase (AMP-forming)/AMP-acid ligase II